MGRIYKKANGKYRVIYDVVEGNKRTQRQKTFDNKKEAENFFHEIEYKKSKKKLTSSRNRLVEEFFEEWIDIYAKNKWQEKTYETNVGIIRNHILPILGHRELDSISPYDIDVFFKEISRKKVSGIKASNLSEKERPFLSSTTLRYIYFILHQVFEKAVEFKLIEENPVQGDAPQKNISVGRTVWSSDDMKVALGLIEHPQLHLAVHLALVGSLRPGEVVGLTWECIDFDNMTIKIDKVLERVNINSLEELNNPRELIRIFPKKSETAKSVLVLKTPKTRQSKRIILITPQLAKELKERKEQVEEYQRILGREFQDFNLVFCFENGCPIEVNRVQKWFVNWQAKTNAVPPIGFQELRHSSVTLKLYLSGDIKSIQADTGHTSGKLILDTYAQMQSQNRINLIGQVSDSLYGEDKHNGNNGATTLDKTVEILKSLKKTNPEVYKIILDEVNKPE